MLTFYFKFTYIKFVFAYHINNFNNPFLQEVLQYKLDNTVSLFLVAVLEYIAADILNLAGKFVLNQHQHSFNNKEIINKEISTEDIRIALIIDRVS